MVPDRESDQTAAVPVTDAMLAAWAMMADQVADHQRPGAANWVMIVRSLIAEVHRLRGASGVSDIVRTLSAHCQTPSAADDGDTYV